MNLLRFLFKMTNAQNGCGKNMKEPVHSAMWTCCSQAGKSRWVEIFRGKGKGTGAVVLGP